MKRKKNSEGFEIEKFIQKEIRTRKPGVKIETRRRMKRGIKGIQKINPMGLLGTVQKEDVDFSRIKGKINGFVGRCLFSKELYLLLNNFTLNKCILWPKKSLLGWQVQPIVGSRQRPRESTDDEHLRAKENEFGSRENH